LVGLGVVLVFVGSVGATLLVLTASPLRSSEWYEPIQAFLSYSVAAGALAVYSRVLEVHPFIGSVSPAKIVRASLCALPLVCVSLGLTGICGELQELQAQVHPSPAIPALVDAGLSVSLIPLVEEIAFRGLLFRAWTLVWGLRRSVVGSSLAFAVLHDDPASAFVLGVLAALVYIRHRSLVSSVILHASYNLLQSWLRFLVESFDELPIAIGSQIPVIGYALPALGGLAFVACLFGRSWHSSPPWILSRE
jgi:membrane protease YdiL (CAAX protease family)